MSEGETSVGRDAIGRHTYIRRQLVVRPKGEHNVVKIEKHNPGRAWLCLPTNDLLVEIHGALQIGDAKCD